MSEKGFGKKKLYTALIAALLLIIAVLAFLLLFPKTGRRDPNAEIGPYEGKTPEQIQDELNRIVEEGMFNVSINSHIIMATGKSEAELRIENIAANNYLMSVKITLDDTGRVIYSSGYIEPGYHIQTAPFDVVLKKGDYEATAIFTAYDTDSGESVGQAAVKIIITVQK